MNKGDLIPDLLGYDAEGNAVERSRFEGTPLIIYFYPKDNTPGCTAEACSIRDDESALRALGYEIIGISRDSAASHRRFAEKYGLGFLLLSDPEAEVNRSFGVWRKKKMAGREYMGTVRTTFVTDAAHRVVHVVEKVDTKHAGAQLLALTGGKE
ncbi:MAG: peroxiredoxin [Prevotellaceae bacterium]|nr:peroxiredoxin [Prevotellaceae bacterium]